MKPTITHNFNKILKTIQIQKQKALQNVKLTPLVKEFPYNIEYKGENNAA